MNNFLLLLPYEPEDNLCPHTDANIIKVIKHILISFLAFILYVIIEEEEEGEEEEEDIESNFSPLSIEGHFWILF